MSRFRFVVGAPLLALLCAGGCQSAPPLDDPVSLVSDAPYACAAGFAERSALLTLPRTEAPTDDAATKGAPLRFAQPLPVGRPLRKLAQETRFDNGWTSLALRLNSDGAQSLSVHLSGVRLPAGTEVWLCSAGGQLRQGPYREAMGGDLWTPVVPGADAWLEVMVHTARIEQLQGTLAEVFGGFR